MNINSIITQFSIEESTSFKSFLRKKNKRTDVKNLELYTLIKKGTPQKELDTALYGTPNRNAYHALSKRLQDNLIDFIATRNFETETSEDMQVLKWILAARILYEQGQYNPARKLLVKATKKAKDLDLYSALVESYHTQLQYSHHHPDIDLNELTAAAQKNMRHFTQQEQLNMAYAHIKKALSFDEQLLKKSIQQVIEEILANFQIQLSNNFTFKSLYQLLEIINRGAHLDHNFTNALPFVTKAFNLIKAKDAVSIKHRFYHIQILYIMANTHFRVRDFERAEQYLVQMQTEMMAERGKYESRFRESHLLVQSFILNYIGKGQLAIKTIEQHVQQNKKQSVDPDIILALIVFLTQQEEYKKALSAINYLKHTDSWYEARMGIDWLIKRELLTLIIYYELEYIDLTHSTLRSFKRKYGAIISSEIRLERFVKVFTQLFNKPNLAEESGFRESVKNLFNTDSLKEEDILMLSFFAWIKSKLNKTRLYETTLKLL